MKLFNIITVTLIFFANTLLAEELTIKELNETELTDMLRGSCIQSTRSCDPNPSIKLIKEAIKSGKKFKMISVDDFPDDGIVVAVQGIGGGGP